MKWIYLLAPLLVAAAVTPCEFPSGGDTSSEFASREPVARTGDENAVATVAGGCFWCVEADFEKVPGVTGVISGYTGGKSKNARYEDVSAGRTEHYEAVQIHYDPSRTSYAELLDVFWRHVDPTDPGGQFVDRGKQYRTAIFYHDATQKSIAEMSRDQLAASGRFDRPIVTEILPYERFYPAEDYHQDFYKTHPNRYYQYRRGSGRDQFIKKVWKDSKEESAMERSSSMYQRPSDEVLRQQLTSMQYRVTQKNGTEPPFRNEYWGNKRAGIYVDVVSGEPLFSSLAKYESGTGWPSFTEPLVPEHVVEHEDRSLFFARTEVRSRFGDSHLGHVFNDGPEPTGLRYCINSAALRFVPADDLESEGYGAYANLFENK